MGSPNWSRIPFEKMPEWKRQEILKRSKKKVAAIDSPVGDDLICDTCGKVCKSKLGMISHKKTHASILN